MTLPLRLALTLLLAGALYRLIHFVLARRAARKEVPGAAAAATAAAEQEESGPENMEESAAWVEYDERQRIMVSYCYEPRTAFPSLPDFFAAQVRRRLAHVDRALIETDVQNYLERVCAMKDISRPELDRLLSRYAWSAVSGRAPQMPQNLRSAILCRDEPSIKQVVWETDQGYWGLVWSKE